MGSLILLRQGNILCLHFEYLGTSDKTEISPGGRSEQTTFRHRAISVGYQDGQWKARLLVSAANPGKY